MGDEANGLGLRRGVVRVDPPSEEWAVEAVRLINRLRRALGNRAVGIEHVGSTAVPGLAAKPIIDLAVGLTTEPDTPSLIAVATPLT
jgi:dephospho-CoA kinase